MSGELEMRNDSPQHYGEVRFNMNKAPCVNLLTAANLGSANYSDDVVKHGMPYQHLVNGNHT